MRKAGLIVVLMAVAICIGRVGAIAAQPAESKEDRDKRMAWFREARFGMFIHWGLYSIPAGEWNGKKVGSAGEWIMEGAQIPVADYEKLAGQFNPVKFDAKQWVRMAKDAGVRYIVITSKHHDGFCLFDSKVSDYTVAKATPFKRDILKELSDACHEQGIVMCWYHSIMDWHHPDAQSICYPRYNGSKSNPNFPRYVENYLKPQVKELLTNYGKIGIMWFDGEWIGDWKPEMGTDMYALCRSIQPDVIVNNRVGKARAGMQGMSSGAGAAGDYGTPEQEIPPTGFPGVDWESCMTMNNTWGFRKDDQNWKSSTQIVRMLIDCSSKGGNLLMNVGPTSEGLIPEASIQRMAEVGQWMKVNNEAIYGTTASPFRKLAWGKCTQKPGKLYLSVFNWPSDGKLLVPVTNKVAKAYLLADKGTALNVTSSDKGAEIAVPAAMPDAKATVVVAEIEGDAKVVETVQAQAADGTIKLAASDAEIMGGTAKVEDKGGEPNIGFWSNSGDSVQWPVNVTKPGTFDVQLTYACQPPAGSQFVVSVGTQKLAGKVEPSGSWSDFKTVNLGKVTIEKTGTTIISVKPERRIVGEGLMNLRSLTLKPAAQ